ncbi:hypothetical protein [Nonomuraea africana]|uniref:Uncharacterized protein n=1 Tax=Nonomuraea africana TaxID=46171 RepID=A0ABR9KDX8_9ACTN|nr:hypothetical protein [Nonomuraea africana]MBE1560228.1 hypothetical protein [Nonomuraea africana]
MLSGCGTRCATTSPRPCRQFEDLAATDTLELLAKAPDPTSASRLTIGQITAALKRARRRGVADKAATILARGLGRL